MNLAARKGAKAGLAERVLAYLEAGDKADAGRHALEGHAI